MNPLSLIRALIIRYTHVEKMSYLFSITVISARRLVCALETCFLAICSICFKIVYSLEGIRLHLNNDILKHVLDHVSDKTCPTQLAVYKNIGRDYYTR